MTDNKDVQETPSAESSEKKKDFRIKSFVVRAGRMTEGQIRAIEELGPKYMVDVEDLKPLDIDAIFGRSAPLVVEIGFGMGVSFVQMAKEAPQYNFLGIEVHPPGVGSALKLIEQEKLTNVKVIKFDAFEVLKKCLKPQSVDILQIFFPDPWPKKRHAKRRLTHVGFLEKYRKLLKKPGELHFKTDNRPLFDFSLEQFEEAGLKVQDVSFDLHAENRPDNIMTEYERKFSGFGEKINRCEVIFA